MVAKMIKHYSSENCNICTYVYWTTEYRYDKKQWYAKQKHVYGMQERWGQSETVFIWLCSYIVTYTND